MTWDKSRTLDQRRKTRIKIPVQVGRWGGVVRGRAGGREKGKERNQKGEELKGRSRAAARESEGNLRGSNCAITLMGKRGREICPPGSN